MRFVLAIFTGVVLMCGVSFAQGTGAEGAPANLPKVINGGVINGKAINLVKPPYPPAARAVKASGAVNVQVTIDENGDVISATAVSGHPLLRAAAVDAARRSKFSPTYLSGQAVKITGIIVYNFTPGSAPQYLTDKQMFPLLGISLLISSMKIADFDAETQGLFLELADEAPPELAEGAELLRKMGNARTKAERNRLIDQLVEALVTQLEGTNQWLAELGNAFGNAVASSEAISKKNSSANRVKFTEQIETIHRLLESPPADISPEFLARVKAISAFDDPELIETDQFLLDFLNGSIKFIDTVVKSR